MDSFNTWRRKWQPTPVFLPGESQGWRSLEGCRLWGSTGLDSTEATYLQQPVNIITIKIKSIPSPKIFLAPLTSQSHCYPWPQATTDLPSIIIDYVEYLFTYLLAICISSLERCLLNSFVRFSIGLFSSCCLPVVRVLDIFWA